MWRYTAGIAEFIELRSKTVRSRWSGYSDHSPYKGFSVVDYIKHLSYLLYPTLSIFHSFSRYFPNCIIILTPLCQLSLWGNRRTRRKPTTFGKVFKPLNKVFKPRYFPNCYNPNPTLSTFPLGKPENNEKTYDFWQSVQTFDLSITCQKKCFANDGGKGTNLPHIF